MLLFVRNFHFLKNEHHICMDLKAFPRVGGPRDDVDSWVGLEAS